MQNTRLIKVRQLCQNHPAFSEASVRWYIFNGCNNGLEASGAVSRLGRKVLIDEEKFIEWAKSGASATHTAAAA